MKYRFVGINIQYPISRLILSGEKTIETRTYPLPKEFVNSWVAIVETPGPSGEFKSRIVAIAKFGESFEYESEKKFYKDTTKHRVDRSSPWAWTSSKPKWGWPILQIIELKKPELLSKRIGIKYTRDLNVSKRRLPHQHQGLLELR